MKKALIGGRGYRLAAAAAIVLGLGSLAACESPVNVDRTSELRVVLQNEAARFPGLVVQVEGAERSYRFEIEDFVQDTSVGYTRLTTERVTLNRSDSVSVRVRLRGPDGPVTGATKFDPVSSDEWILSLAVTVDDHPTFECSSCVDSYEIPLPAALQDNPLPELEEALWLIWIRGPSESTR